MYQLNILTLRCISKQALFLWLNLFIFIRLQQRMLGFVFYKLLLFLKVPKKLISVKVKIYLYHFQEEDSHGTLTLINTVN